MTQAPPVPQANQSPYPKQEPPHVAPEATLPPVVSKDDAALVDRLRDLPLLTIGAAIGLGAAAIGGAVFGWLRTRPEPRGKRSRKS